AASAVEMYGFVSCGRQLCYWFLISRILALHTSYFCAGERKNGKHKQKKERCQGITAIASPSIRKSSRNKRRTSTAVLAGGCRVFTNWSRIVRTTGIWLMSSR